MGSWIRCERKSDSQAMYINFDFVRAFYEVQKGGTLLEIPKHSGAEVTVDKVIVTQTPDELSAALKA